MTAKTPAERQAAYRARKAATPEVRGIYARPEDHAEIKAFVAALFPKKCAEPAKNA